MVVPTQPIQRIFCQSGPNTIASTVNAAISSITTAAMLALSVVVSGSVSMYVKIHPLAPPVKSFAKVFLDYMSDHPVRKDGVVSPPMGADSLTTKSGNGTPP